ncbi:MAG: PEGA domain-containing protein [Myxococcota bacterium]|nr:PEGA domain-containing protein [Myxococcota bacterium]
MYRYMFLCCLTILFLPQTALAEVRLAVLEFRGVGVSETLLQVLSDKVRSGVLHVSKGQQINGEDLIIMTRENMMAVLNDQGLSAEDCTGSCEVDIAKNIGADYVISGNLSKIDELYILSIKLHETAKSNLLGSESLETEKKRELISGAEQIGSKVFQAGLNLSGGQASSGFQGGFSGGTDDWNPDANEAKKVVSFSSNPKGAAVVVNGVVACAATPCSKSFAPKRHQVSVQKDRYRIWNQTIDFQAQNNVSAELEPKFGTLNVSTSVAGIQLKVDKTIVKTPIQNMELDVGPHTIVVDDPCYNGQQYQFKTKAGKPENINNYPIKAKPSAIDITVQDRDGNELAADVSVDGKKQGTSPGTFKLPLCSQMLQVSYQGKTTSQRLSLKERETQKINLTMGVQNTNFNSAASFSQSAGSVTLQRYMEMKISGPKDKNASPQYIQRVLNKQVKAKIEALKQVVEELVNRFISKQSTPLDLNVYALAMVYLAYENYAETILTSYIPTFFDEMQVEIYKMQLEDQAFQYRKQGRAYLVKASELLQGKRLLDPNIKSFNRSFRDYLINDQGNRLVKLWPQDGRWPLQEKDVHPKLASAVQLLDHGDLQSAKDELQSLSHPSAKQLEALLDGEKKELKKRQTQTPELCAAFAFTMKKQKLRKQLRKCLKIFPSLSLEEEIARFIEWERAQRYFKKEAAERKKRQQASFNFLKSEYENTQQRYNLLSDRCSSAQAQETLMEVEIYLGQVAVIIEMNEYEVASDALHFVREVSSMMEDIEPSCQ